VILAKTFGFVYGQPVAGANAFDLIDPTGVAVLPSKKGEYFVRRPGSAPNRQSGLPEAPFTGYGPDVPEPEPPHAARFASLLAHLEPSDPAAFVPEYLIDPSISTPKKPFRRAEV
jgi:hypothetical protein